jgi:hypothetical protein
MNSWLRLDEERLAELDGQGDNAGSGGRQQRPKVKIEARK